MVPLGSPLRFGSTLHDSGFVWNWHYVEISLMRFLSFFITFIVCVFVYAHAIALAWRSEDALQELVLSYHVGPGNQTQVIMLGTRHFSPLRHLAGPLIRILTLDSLVVQCYLH